MTVKQPIMLLEVLAVFYLVKLFGSLLRNRRALFLIDNTSGMHSVIAGHNKKCHTTSRLIVKLHEELEALQTSSWFEYVQTKFNPADPLSRLPLLQKALKDMRLELVQGDYPLPEIVASDLYECDIDELITSPL